MRATIRALRSTIAVWMAMLLLGPPVWLAMGLLPGPSARWRLARLASRVLCRAAGVTLQVDGSLPDDDTPYVVVANHESYVDALLVILASIEPVVFVAGSALSSQRIAGPLLRNLGCQFVGGPSGEPASAVLARLESVLRGGRSLAMFPEGSLSPSVGLRRFRGGAFMVAAAAGRPVVPIGITGTREIVPPGRRAVRGGMARAAIGEAIYPTGSDRRAAATLAFAARGAVARLSGAGRSPAGPEPMEATGEAEEAEEP